MSSNIFSISSQNEWSRCQITSIVFNVFTTQFALYLAMKKKMNIIDYYSPLFQCFLVSLNSHVLIEIGRWKFFSSRLVSITSHLHLSFWRFFIFNLLLETSHISSSLSVCTFFCSVCYYKFDLIHNEPWFVVFTNCKMITSSLSSNLFI